MNADPPPTRPDVARTVRADHDALPAGTRFGEFEIIRVLGVGGFGIVYLAWDHSLERRVALKEYMPSALSARVGSITDNRLGGWLSYRASKAALNQIIKTLAIELARTRPQTICVALHPGTVDTALSAPFQRGLPDGQLLTPADSANQLLDVIDRLTATDSGGCFDFRGERIAP